MQEKTSESYERDIGWLERKLEAARHDIELSAQTIRQQTDRNVELCKQLAAAERKLAERDEEHDSLVNMQSIRIEQLERKLAEKQALVDYIKTSNDSGKLDSFILSKMLEWFGTDELNKLLAEEREKQDAKWLAEIKELREFALGIEASLIPERSVSIDGQERLDHILSSIKALIPRTQAFHHGAGYAAGVLAGRDSMQLEMSQMEPVGLFEVHNTDSYIQIKPEFADIDSVPLICRPLPPEVES